MSYYYDNEDYLEKVNPKEIAVFEEKAGIKFPRILEDFYLEHGYGFIKECPDRPKRLLSPLEILDFLTYKNEYQFIEDKEFYDEIKNVGLVFMEYDSNIFFWIGTNICNSGKVYYYNSEIAPSFTEFIDMLHKGENPLNNIKG